MHLVNATPRSLKLLPRFIVTVALVLALLSTLVPFGSASSAQLCMMECCAELVPHAAGSCHMDMSMHGNGAGGDTQKPEPDHSCGLPHSDNDAQNGIVAGVMGMKADSDSSLDLDGVTIDASEHCNKNTQSENAIPSPRDLSQPASIAAQSFSKPCPPECGTGALSSGVRPSRHSVALAFNARPRLPTLGRKSQYTHGTFLATSTYCKQLRPRGPPLVFS